MSWDVKAGDYPIGLYWQLANEYSKDAGLDLNKLKGTNVEVWKYSLTDGLPGKNEQSQFNYPSDLILLVKSDKVVGAWMMFNTMSIGPSVKNRYLNNITKLTYEEWINQKGLFSNLDKNKDLETLQPVEVMKAYFKAINDGDKTRADACLSPDAMLESLTMNINSNSNKNILYNTGFNEMNSQTENIIKANPISFSFLDPNTPATTIKEIGNLTKIEVSVKVDIKFHNNGASSDGLQERFALMKKYKTGWKLDGLGTGP